MMQIADRYRRCGQNFLKSELHFPFFGVGVGGHEIVFMPP